MKSWHIFLLGAAVTVAAVSIRAYEQVLAAIAAMVILGLVVLGFLMRPQREVFYLLTTVYIDNPDDDLIIQHEYVAVQIELVHLWLLFIPAFGAIAFLLFVSARGVFWNFSTLNWLLNIGPQSCIYFVHLPIIGVVALVSAWIGERSILRDAAVCNAEWVDLQERALRYSFLDQEGSYYGGTTVPFPLAHMGELGAVVMYNIRNPHLNRLMAACFFHELVIIGRGLTEFDAQTVAASTRTIPVTSQTALIGGQAAAVR